MDQIMEELKAVEGKMYILGQGGITVERLSRTYANALIGEIALQQKLANHPYRCPVYMVRAV